MNTRKQFLRDGFGLAAILSSQTAPAILVRSMAAARNGIVLGRKRLPYDAEVEYLESTSGGGQWIDTNYLFTSNKTKVEALFYSTQNSGQVLFGAEVSTQRTLTPLLYVDGNNKFSVFIARSPRAINKVDATAGLYSVTIESNSTGQVDFNYNGTVYSGTFTGDVYRDLPISLFAERFPTKIDYYSKNLKFYSFKIWDNNVLVRDFIPVRVGGVGYMYDKVSKQLFGNQGSGNFIVGPDVVEVEYLESTGTQYIDTLFKANTTTTRLDISLEVTDATLNQGVFGSRNAATGRYDSCNAFILAKNIFRPDWAAGDGSTLNNITISPNTVYEMSITRGTLVINGETRTYSSTASVDQTHDFLLFNFTNGSDSPFSTGLKGRIRYARLYSNNVLARDMVPVRIGTEGALKDALTRRFYRNAGTGNFSYGADKAA